MKRIDPNLTLSEKRAIAGSRGGRKTVRRHGKRYMKRLARWAAHCMHATYRITPVGTCQYALVHRTTGEIKAFLSGKPAWKKEQDHESLSNFIP